MYQIQTKKIQSGASSRQRSMPYISITISLAFIVTCAADFITGRWASCQHSYLFNVIQNQSPPPLNLYVHSPPVRSSSRRVTHCQFFSSFMHINKPPLRRRALLSHLPGRSESRACFSFLFKKKKKKRKGSLSSKGRLSVEF